MLICLSCIIKQMPQHGDYDQKSVKWFCSIWVDKKEWLEIHGYSPLATNFDTDEEEEVVESG